MIRYGDRLGRGLFVAGYERSYRRRAAVDQPAAVPWMVVHAAARFAERIEGEYPALTRFLERHAAPDG